jgi:acetyl/propionyl-CoA carboxylase alpha subunit
MKIALSEYAIIGVKTQIPFLMDVINHPQFNSGDLHTHFIKQHFPDWKPGKSTEKLKLALVAAAIIKTKKSVQPERDTPKTTLTPWQLTGRWELFSK